MVVSRECERRSNNDNTKVDLKKVGKSGSLEVWKSGSLEVWESGSLEVWKSKGGRAEGRRVGGWEVWGLGVGEFYCDVFRYLMRPAVVFLTSTHIA